MSPQRTAKGGFAFLRLWLARHITRAFFSRSVTSRTPAGVLRVLSTDWVSAPAQQKCPGNGQHVLEMGLQYTVANSD